MMRYWAIHQPDTASVDLIVDPDATWLHPEVITTISCDEDFGTSLSLESLDRLADAGWSILASKDLEQTPMGRGTRIEPDGFAVHFLSFEDRRSGRCTVYLRAMRYDGEYVDLHLMDQFDTYGTPPIAELLNRIDTRLSGVGWNFGAPWLQANWRREAGVEIVSYERIVLRDPAVFADVPRSQLVSHRRPKF